MLRRNYIERINMMLKCYKKRGIRRFARYYLLEHGCDIPLSVNILGEIHLPHPVGIVVHPYTSIGNGVKIYQNVTIGRGDIWKEPDDDFEGFEIEEDVVLGAGCKVICSHGKLRIGKGSVIGANSVVLSDVPPYSIVTGIPGKITGKR